MRNERPWSVVLLLAGALALGAAPVVAGVCDGGGPFTQGFRLQDCTYVNNGRTPWFVLQPGYWLRLRGREDGQNLRLQVTVLAATEVVAGVTTRVVEEREWADGELVEVSRNYVAICRPTNNVVYFGEHVDNYEDGQIVDHEGSWRAGEDGARPGVLMPGSFMLGARYYQEIAPEVALDRACNRRMGLEEWTHAGTFHGCVETLETNPLEPGDESFKAYCPGIGMVRDEVLRLYDWSERP